MTPQRIVVIQTAFIGDVILTLPMVQRLHRAYPQASIAFVAIPSAAGVLEHHPDITEIIPYDKRNRDRGPGGFMRLVHHLRQGRFDLAVIPHRSLRSALLGFLAGIPVRIGFNRSAGRLLLSKTVRYRSSAHEIERNLDLLTPLGVPPGPRLLPRVYPNADDENVVDQALSQAGIHGRKPLVAVAPGSVWATKRWPGERYAQLCDMLAHEGWDVVLLGGEADQTLNGSIRHLARIRPADLTGQLSLLQSAALIRRCAALITNDSAPEHLAAAVDTPVVAIFGPTVPEFGFAPSGPFDTVVQVEGLRCRPCAIHGGKRCPITTFECMLRIPPERVFEVAGERVRNSSTFRSNPAGDRGSPS